MRKKLDRKGFSITEVLLTIVVIAAVAACAWLAWRHVHDKKQSSKTAGSSQQSKSSTSSSPGSTTTDVYAGWKTYCDTTYKYCFKYPSGWTIQTTSATKLGDEGGAALISPDQTVQVAYGNAFVKDGSVASFVPKTISKLTTANQDLTLVGGYVPSSGDNGLAGNNLPVYEVIDSSVLGTYPLVVGQQGQFPSNERFSDQLAADSGFNGALTAKPTVTIETVAQSEAWLNSQSAQTAANVLKSLSYSPSSN